MPWRIARYCPTKPRASSQAIPYAGASCRATVIRSLGKQVNDLTCERVGHQRLVAPAAARVSRQGRRSLSRGVDDERASRLSAPTARASRQKHQWSLSKHLDRRYSYSPPRYPPRWGARRCVRAEAGGDLGRGRGSACPEARTAATRSPTLSARRACPKASRISASFGDSGRHVCTVAASSVRNPAAACSGIRGRHGEIRKP